MTDVRDNDPQAAGDPGESDAELEFDVEALEDLDAGEDAERVRGGFRSCGAACA